jgi:hypothetical protein
LDRWPTPLVTAWHHFDVAGRKNAEASRTRSMPRLAR